MKYPRLKAACIAGSVLSPLYLSIAVAGYWLIFEPLMFKPVVQMTAQPWTSDSRGAPRDTFRPGEYIYVNWQFQRKLGCEVDVERLLINDTRRVLAVDHGLGRETEGEQTIRHGFRIPDDISPGPHLYQVRATYKCNPLWRFSWSSPTIPFEVRP